MWTWEVQTWFFLTLMLSIAFTAFIKTEILNYSLMLSLKKKPFKKKSLTKENELSPLWTTGPVQWKFHASQKWNVL